MDRPFQVFPSKASFLVFLFGVALEKGQKKTDEDGGFDDVSL